MTKLMVSFHSFVRTPNNKSDKSLVYLSAFINILALYFSKYSVG
jgi:hypothetical protein